MGIDLDSLRCFDAAATALNFRAAATRVHLSPAAFSDRIRRLEDDLGAPLFLRSTRTVALTQAGQRLWPLTRELLDDAARLRAAATGRSQPPPFELLIGTRAELGLSWLCPALDRLAQARPERTLHLYNGDGPDLLARLERGDLDAMVSSMRLTGGNLAFAALHPEDYVFVARPGVRVRGPDDVRRLTLLDAGRGLPLFRYLVDALPDGAPWPFARVEYLGGIGAIRHRLLAGDGRVAVLPRYFVAADLRAGKLRRILPAVTPRADAFRLVWRARHPRESELVALATELRDIPLR